MSAGAIGWATWLLLIIAGALLLVINTSLIAALRHVTRGGVVRTHNHNVSESRTACVLGADGCPSCNDASRRKHAKHKQDVCDAWFAHGCKGDHISAICNRQLAIRVLTMLLFACLQSWWLRHSRPLLAAVKLMLFFLSFVISNAVYFAAFFGPDSCFFSRTGKPQQKQTLLLLSLSRLLIY